MNTIDHLDFYCISRGYIILRRIIVNTLTKSNKWINHFQIFGRNGTWTCVAELKSGRSKPLDHPSPQKRRFQSLIYITTLLIATYLRKYSEILKLLIMWLPRWRKHHQGQTPKNIFKFCLDWNLPLILP